MDTTLIAITITFVVGMCYLAYLADRAQRNSNHLAVELTMAQARIRGLRAKIDAIKEKTP